MLVYADKNTNLTSSWLYRYRQQTLRELCCAFYDTRHAGVDNSRYSYISNVGEDTYCCLVALVWTTDITSPCLGQSGRRILVLRGGACVNKGRF